MSKFCRHIILTDLLTTRKECLGAALEVERGKERTALASISAFHALHLMEGKPKHLQNASSLFFAQLDKL